MPALRAAVDDRSVGSKAVGLAALPSLWTPPFVALDEDFALSWRAGCSVETALGSRISEQIDQLLAVAKSKRTRILVRSDGLAEYQHPGRRRTRVVGANRSALLAALDSAMLELGADGRPIAQLAVEPSLIGLMSNERRVTQDSSRFLVEGLPGDHGLRWVNPSRKAAASDLRAETLPLVVTALENVAAAAESHGRMRIEFAWDGARLWVLQADIEAPSPPDLLADTYLANRDPVGAWPVADGSPLFPGAKVERHRVLQQLGFPVPPLFASADELGDSPLERLEKTIQKLSGQTVIVRTDVGCASPNPTMLLPTSPRARDYAAIASWAETTAQAFGEAGFNDDDWTFLVSELVPARVSAWAAAQARSETVLIDAVWGFPDGLLHLAHDSYRLVGHSITEQRIRHKSACILCDETWHYARVPEPMDWEPTLNTSELSQLGDWSRTLADHLACDVQLMVLAHIGGESGPGAMAPFHFTTIPQTERSLAKSQLSTELVVQTPDDLAALIEARAHTRAHVIRLDFPMRSLRDPSVLREIGKAAAQVDIPIAFHGSRLGHAFHVLSQTGAIVLTADVADDLLSGQEEDGVWAVLRRVPGLERIQTLDWRFWSDRLSRVLGRLEDEYRDETATSIIDLLAMNLDRESAIGRSRKLVAEGRFHDLARVVEFAPLEIPPSRDIPGVVSLFMDEGEADPDSPTTPSTDGLAISLRYPPNATLPPVRARRLLDDCLSIEVSSGVATIVFAKETPT